MVTGGRVHRVLIPIALAVSVAIGGSLVAFGAAPSRPSEASAGLHSAKIGQARQPAAKRAPRRVEVVERAAVAEPARPVAERPATATPANSVANTPVAASRPLKTPAATVTTSTKPPKSGSTSGVYRGRNRVWIPSLGVNRGVSFYSCSRSSPLANVVYRWGCGGSNNVYLMGHAWGVFRALHNAYYNGKLRKGMEVIYADGNGRVSRYRVSFWKVVSPVGQSWAYASQSRPSLTLQTCIGKNSQYRLVVRLVKSG